MPERRVIQADALEWLDGQADLGSIVTGLPDAREVGMDDDLVGYRRWFLSAVALAMQAASPGGAAIFYQTDRKVDRQWLDKAYWLNSAAELEGLRLLWHKIVLRREVGATDLHRPGYSHMLAFSREAGPGRATPDVIPAGMMVYENAIGLRAAHAALAFVSGLSDQVVDPFVGRGTVLALAERYGLDSIGVDIDEAQCAYARRMRIK